MRLYRECLRRARFIGHKQHNTELVVDMVRQQFKKHMHETDPEKIQKLKDDAARGLINHILYESEKMSGRKFSSNFVPSSFHGPDQSWTNAGFCLLGLDQFIAVTGIFGGKISYKSCSSFDSFVLGSLLQFAVSNMCLVCLYDMVLSFILRWSLSME
ncbi:hypothetical protein ACLOJK_021929 [Asimina triloba]